MELRISQSLIKAFEKYRIGETCGVQFEKIYISRTITMPDSVAMRKGRRFEYLALGILEKGKAPEPFLTKAGAPSADETKVLIQARNFQDACKYYGWKVNAIDTKLEVPYRGHTLVAKKDADMLDSQGNHFILDTKYSALLYNKWEDNGWDIQKLPYHGNLLIQPAFYKYVEYLATGQVNTPFYFCVHSSTNTIDYEIFEIKIGDWDIFLETMDNYLQGLIQNLLFTIEMESWIAAPKVRRCCGDDEENPTCPYFNECLYAMTIPKITPIYPMTLW